MNDEANHLIENHSNEWYCLITERNQNSMVGAIGLWLVFWIVSIWDFFSEVKKIFLLDYFFEKRYVQTKKCPEKSIKVKICKVSEFLWLRKKDVKKLRCSTKRCPKKRYLKPKENKKFQKRCPTYKFGTHKSVAHVLERRTY